MKSYMNQTGQSAESIDTTCNAPFGNHGQNWNHDAVTAKAVAANSRSVKEDPRLAYILERLVTHLHTFAQETRLSTPEWQVGLEFLTEVGKTCSEVRQVCQCCTPSKPPSLGGKSQFRILISVLVMRNHYC